MIIHPFANQGRVRQPGAYSAPALTFDLDRELRSVEAEEPWQAAHTAKTLVKYPDLRIVLVALRAGGRLQQHETRGRISIQTLFGCLRVHMPGQDLDLPTGHLLAIDRDVPHEVVAPADSAFLLTIAWPATAVSAMRPTGLRHEFATLSIEDPTAGSAQASAQVIRINDVRISREHGLDKTLADTFPCSDAFSSIPDPLLSGT